MIWSPYRRRVQIPSVKIVSNWRKRARVLGMISRPKLPQTLNEIKEIKKNGPGCQGCQRFELDVLLVDPGEPLRPHHGTEAIYELGFTHLSCLCEPLDPFFIFEVLGFQPDHVLKERLVHL